MELLFFFLPSIIGLIVAGFIWSRKFLNLSENLLAWCILIASIYMFFAAVICVPNLTPEILVWSHIGLGVFAPTVQLTICMVCWSLYTQQQRYNRLYLLFHLIPALTGILMLIGYVLVGFERAAYYIEVGYPAMEELTEAQRMIIKTFLFLTNSFYRTVTMVSSLLSAGYLIYLLIKTDFKPMVVVRFFFGDGPIRPVHLIIIVYLTFLLLSLSRQQNNRGFALEHLGEYSAYFVVQSVLLVMMGAIAVCLKKPCVYLREPHPQPHYEDLPVHFKDTMTTGQEFSDEESDSYRTLNLRDDFLVLMREEACYLQPGMSRYSVCKQLNVSRRGLDHLIKLLYNTTYRDYVIVQRVEYYNRYISQYNDEPEESVAMACGFPSKNAMHSQIRECRAFFAMVEKQKSMNYVVVDENVYDDFDD